MPFAAFTIDDFGARGAEAFELKVPYDEGELKLAMRRTEIAYSTYLCYAIVGTEIVYGAIGDDHRKVAPL
eukprot:2699376-Rhodomonas_salina.1